MDFKVLTLFPELVDAFFDHGIIGRARERKIITGNSINIRDFTSDKHKTVDDRPYGGGSGMVLRPEPVSEAICYAIQQMPNAKVILMTPQGMRFDQKIACSLADERLDLIIVCGRYEGIDERIYNLHVDMEISIGDYILTGGELSAMSIIDAVIRLIPGVLGSEDSSLCDSFIEDRLEYAQYTRPKEFQGMQVPTVLLSGNHEGIQLWRKESELKRTFLKRPDLFEKMKPSKEEKIILLRWSQELMALAGENDLQK